MIKNKFIIGSRGSKLALWQANHVKEKIEIASGLPVEIKIIKTLGDKVLDVPLAKIGSKGLFVKEIENALLDEEVDLAVHSMKDVPTELPDGLSIRAMLVREDAKDALISKSGSGFADLPHGGVVATSSLRRQAQLKHARRDLKFVDVRGNLDTRLAKMETGEFDAIILATAGLKRLGYGGSINEILGSDVILSAVGQGAIGIETRDSDAQTNNIVDMLNHRDTFVAVTAERKFLATLEGGCQIPIGSFGVINGDHIELHGVVADLEGVRLYRDSVSGDFKDDDRSSIEQYGTLLAERMNELGATEILDEIRAQFPHS